MIRFIYLTLAATLLTGMLAAQSTVLTGKVTDDHGEPLSHVSIKVMSGPELIRGGFSEDNGDYRIQVDPGSYDVEFYYAGWTTTRIKGVNLENGKLNRLDVAMATTTIAVVEVHDYVNPLVKLDGTTTDVWFDHKQLEHMPTRNIGEVIAQAPGVSTTDNVNISIRGGRPAGTKYFLDGIATTGALPPLQDIEQLQVITGGVGAEYGDATGGLVSATSKGPASAFRGQVNIESSKGLDPYGYMLATANVSGPIIRKKLPDGNVRTVVGFRLSATWNKQKDDKPSAVPLFRVKDSVLKNLEAHPLTKSGATVTNAAEKLTQDSVESLKYHPFEGRQDIDLTGKLDFRLSDKIDLSITGTFKDARNQFTPGTWGNGSWQLLNAQNNPTDYGRRYRTIARFRHRLGNDGDQVAVASANQVAISNASYSIQFGYERGTDRQFDPRHEDRLFDYGYIGRFGFEQIPVFGADSTHFVRQIGYQEKFTGFAPGYLDAKGKLIVPNGGTGTDPAKGGLVAYNEFATPNLYTSYSAVNGRISSTYTSIWGGMHGNINQVYDRNSKSQDDVFTLAASSNFDLRLGRTGVHSIQFGLLNEQRTSRSWTIAPFGLWTLATLQANSHFNGLDYSNPAGKVYYQPIGDSLTIYNYNLIEQPDATFYKKVRSEQSTPIDLHQYVNVNGMSPDQLNLGMFSARELTDQGLVRYYGYDYLGNKTPNGVTFNDFFKATDAQGVRTFPVAALNPLYQAAYIKDKFTFNKMIFSLGLRVERYDLNTKVLRDPYSLYQVMNAKDFYKTVNTDGVRPGTIADNFKVYVKGAKDPTPVAFRDGDTWYFGDGRQANDGNVIFGGGVVTPMLANPVVGSDIFDRRFDPTTAFEDYKPTINWLPRLAFSFPISKEANFFAHYDVLVQRPPDNWQVTPLDYLYFYTPGRTPVNNASLKPERVVDYEVGFQQKITENSALKISAYYREMRDMIQARTILYVPVIGQYETYGNLDFGTVKGFTAQYETRRIQNMEMRLSYTLQFADGTGSDANSQRGLTTRGNLRTLFPLSFDERHNVQASLDYRYEQGEAYNGPRLFGKDILANFGVNMLVSGISGRPYTAKKVPKRFGGDGTVGTLNGNRLPWRFNLDLRVDKTFDLSQKGKRAISLNVYVRVSNLLNFQNALNVYPVTGSPTDDGFRTSQEGQQVLKNIQASGQSLAAYQSAYSWVMLDPSHFNQPRRIYAGASLNF